MLRGVSAAAILLGIPRQSHACESKADHGREREPVVHSVVIRNFAFEPDEIHIRVGDRVEWTNEDIVPHTATGSDEGHPWDTELLAPNQSAGVVFPASGSHDYFCAFHTNMKGRVVVQS